MSNLERPLTRQKGRGPSLAKTAQTRRAIIAAALDSFSERGFSETRMIDVAERAGLGKGTLYLYFPDKEALFEGVLREVVSEPLADAVGSSPQSDESTRAYLRRTLLPLLRTLEGSRRAAVIRLVVSEGARFPVLTALYRQLVLEPAMEVIRGLADRAMARNELTSDALVRFPLLLIAPGVIATLWNGLYGKQDPMDAAAMVEAFLDLVFGPAEEQSSVADQR